MRYGQICRFLQLRIGIWLHQGSECQTFKRSMQYLQVVFSSGTISSQESCSVSGVSSEQFQPRFIPLLSYEPKLVCQVLIKVWITSDLNTFQLSECSHGLHGLKLISWSTAISRSHVFRSVVYNFHFRVISSTERHFGQFQGERCLLQIKFALWLCCSGGQEFGVCNMCSSAM